MCARASWHTKQCVHQSAGFHIHTTVHVHYIHTTSLLLCIPRNVFISWPDFTSQILQVRSIDPVMHLPPSQSNWQLEISPRWPWKVWMQRLLLLKGRGGGLLVSDITTSSCGRVHMCICQGTCMCEYKCVYVHAYAYIQAHELKKHMRNSTKVLSLSLSHTHTHNWRTVV